jgi:hypothetical protein
MKLFFKRGRIGEKLVGKIFPSIINILNVWSSGVGHLSLAKNDYYCADV